MVFRVAINEWFKLPRLGREFFISLMKAGLIYDKSKGFKAESNSDLATISSILKRALGEDFGFAPKCFICNSILECYSCAYYLICDVKSLTPNCLCDKCMNNEDAFAIYSNALMKKMS
ncbi:MAG: hypothetical protein H3Z53_09235 [archaeon]|nr:hypothetical protein [archaeon]